MSKPKTTKRDDTHGDEHEAPHAMDDVAPLTHEETEARALEKFAERYHVKCHGGAVASASTEDEAQALLEEHRAKWLERMQRRGYVRITQDAEGKKTEHWRGPVNGANAWTVEDTEAPPPAPPETDENGEPLHASDDEPSTQP